MTDAPACPLCDPGNDGPLCARCIRRVRRALVDVPGLVDDLESTVTRQATGQRTRRPEGHPAPLPFVDGPKITEARQCVAALQEWARHVGGDGRGARSAALTLLGADEWFRESDQAPRAGRVILQIRAALRRAVDRPAARFYAGKCGAELTTLVVDQDGDVLTPALEVSTCDGDVYAEPGDPLALCSECRVGHPVVERRETLLAALEWVQLPLPEILAALPVLIGSRPEPATVRQWRARGRLEAASTTPTGVALYRAGDVIRLARASRKRKTA